MKLRIALILLAVSALAASCASRGVIAERPVPVENEVYHLDTGDQLRVTVFGQADLSGDFAVDGMRHLHAAAAAHHRARPHDDGRSLEDVVEAELGERLLRNPNVSIQVMQFRPFFILGEVQNAGQYPYVSGMTVQSAAAIAGGFTYRADAGRVTITRNRGDRVVEIGVDSTAAVMPGDTILVRERYF